MSAALRRQVESNNLLRFLGLPVVMTLALFLAHAAQFSLPRYLPWLGLCFLITAFLVRDYRLSKAEGMVDFRRIAFWLLNVVVLAILIRAIGWAVSEVPDAGANAPGAYGPKASGVFTFFLAFSIFEFFRPSKVDGADYQREGYSGLVSIAVVSFAWTSWAYAIFAVVFGSFIVK